MKRRVIPSAYLFYRIMDLIRKYLLLGLMVMVMLNACKEPDGIGLEVLPDGEKMPIAWDETFSIEARTVYYDSVQTSGLQSGTYLIGDFGDPIFGRVTSTFYGQFQLPTTNPEFSSQAVCDSIILNLVYLGAYGSIDKLKGTMRFGVYELAQDLYDTRDSTYYSTSDITLGTQLADVTFRPDLYSEVPAGADTLPPSLRIALDRDLGDRILRSTNLASDDIFWEEFEGLCVKSLASTMPDGFGSILYFNIASTNSRLEMYYHDEADTTEMMFNIVNPNGIHTRFQHEFPSEITTAVADSTDAGANTLYIQSMAGLRMKLDIPYLTELNQLGAVAINKAELVVPIDESVITEFGYPEKLNITGIDSSGNSTILTDFFEGTDYYGGVYDSENKEYVFNIARYVQYVLNHPEKPNYGLYVVNSGNAVNARRGVFNGPNHPDKPLKLRMTYTIIE